MDRTHARGAVLGVILALVALGSAFAVLFYGSETVGYGPPEYVIEPDAFAAVDVSAQSWVIFDVETGKVLGGRAIGEVRPIASVTKLVTAEMAMQLLDLSATTTVSLRAIETEGRAGDLHWGEQITVGDLLFPLLLSSSNDAAEVLAEAAGRADFIAAMNAHAASLGMVGTFFADPSGLSAQNRATAYDLQILLEHLYANESGILHITRLPAYAHEDHDWPNVNPVRLDRTFAGGKNGYTDYAGRTLAAIFNEPLGAGMTRPIGIVLLASDDIVTDVATLRAELHRSVRYEERER